MKRKMMAWLLILSLLFSFALAEETVTDEEWNQLYEKINDIRYNQDARIYVSDAVYIGEELYGISNGSSTGICRLNGESWEQMTIACDTEFKNGFPYNTGFLSTENGVRLLFKDSGEVYCMSVAGDTVTLTKDISLPWDDMMQGDGDYKWARNMDSPTVLGDILYFVTYTDTWERVILGVNLKTGEWLPAMTIEDGVNQICAYKDGFAVLTYEDISYHNLKTGKTEKLLPKTYNIRAIGAGEGDTLFYVQGNVIYSNRTGTFAPAGYIGNDAHIYDSVNKVMFRAPDTVVLVAGDNIAKVDVNPAHLPDHDIRLLTGPLEEIQNALNEFAQLYPKVPVVQDNSMFVNSTQDLVDKLSGANPMDLYVVSAQQMNLALLAKKGYIAPIEDEEFFAKIAPQYKDAVTYQGRPYAYPVYVDGGDFGVSVKALEKVGLSEADIPKTFMELLEFIDMWQSDYAQEYPEMRLLESQQYINLKIQLIQEILGKQILKCKALGEDIQFRDPYLADLLTRIGKTDFYGFYDPNSEEPIEDDGIAYSDDDPIAIFNTYQDVPPSMYEQAYQLMPLSLTEGDTAYLPVDMYVLVVNPRSAHKEEAMALAHALAGNLAPKTKITIMPDYNEPQESDYMIRYLANVPRVIAQLEEVRDAQTKEEMKETVQQAIDNFQQEVKESETRRWLISPEVIAAFRARDAVIVPATPETILPEDLYDSMQKLSDGAITVQDFLREVDRTYQMMSLEGD